MSIIEKAVEKFTSEGIEPNRILQRDDKVSSVFSSITVEADKVLGNSAVEPKDFTSDTFKEQEVENLEIIEVDPNRLKKAHLTVNDDDNPRLSEELRMIKRRLLVNAAGLGDEHVENGNLIMVTSSVPDEGKTFIATNLALSIAREIDRTVLLVDADIAKSDVTKTFGLTGSPGLTEFLNGEAQCPEVIHHTNIQGLSILPTGQKASNSTELLSSNKMTDLIKQLSNYSRERIVVIDSPPLLVTSEAQVLASLVGQVAFVVKANETLEKEFISAIERLDHSKYVGLILNQSDEEAESGYYGYYHNS